MRPKSRRSDYAKSEVSDDESNFERFDPLDKEFELVMTGSMASLKFIQKKLALIMGPLFKMWREMDGANQGKETSEMFITEVLNLIERTVLLVEQVNVACLYERRINFMAKILKGMKQDKQTLSHNQSMLTESGEALFGDNFYNVLDKKSKIRKRAKEMAKNGS
ncbi:unnamed protein product [Mytilus coruscus]|uniref:Uncharacterized protein n=1 Tax=Mytilus coruscus TaxID=42192 RepID=A0A6J8DWV4_MYTCO|nr:unnamed protein product [Mytilus coruscus]